MASPSTLGQEGPSYAPPPLPEGWIAQWDGVSRKYYFVQLSTGSSQWETPTHAAPTGPTPQATPQGTEHPYGTPGQQGPGHPQDLDIVTNADGSQSVRLPDGRLEPYSGDRSLSSFAMNQLMGGKKNNHGASGLAGMASSFLGGGSKPSGGSSNSHSTGGASGIVGALAGTLLGGGKKPHQGGQSEGQHAGGGLMGSVAGMFGGSHGGAQQGGNDYGYSSGGNQHGGYSGSAPPTSYQPSGTAHTVYAPPPQHGQGPPGHAQPQQGQGQQGPLGQHGQNPNYSSTAPNQSYNSPSPSYGGGPPPSGTPSYGAPPHSQQPQYGAPPNSQGPPYGGPQHHDSFGGGHPPQGQQHYPPPPGGGYPGGPQQGPPQHSGNLAQPQHSHFQGMHNAEHSGGLYGNNPGGHTNPPVPTGSHPNQGQQGQYPPPPGGQYGGPGGGQYW